MLEVSHVDRRRSEQLCSGQMVDRFQVVIDRHPEMFVIVAGTNDVSPDRTLLGDGDGRPGEDHAGDRGALETPYGGTPSLGP